MAYLRRLLSQHKYFISAVPRKQKYRTWRKPKVFDAHPQTSTTVTLTRYIRWIAQWI